MAVQKAIRSGRIVLSADGTVDPEQADVMWSANTSERTRPFSADEVISYSETQEVSANALHTDNRSIGSTHAIMHKIRQRREYMRLQIEELEFKRKRGELIEIELIRQRWAEIGRIMRNSLETIPQRVRSRAPDMPDEHVRILETCVNQVMSELARHADT